ncbi:hypothetical protein QYE76_005484 [Lolium multiflorum]|uniref:F-box domain-containing protein n=1 Tax=Lolium multiflorum TaxID=4521 RepID=A0AAD8RUT6_LOLMU|nr:hypothetical protein QYE76_005484 [Lolium multiflorum]
MAPARQRARPSEPPPAADLLASLPPPLLDAILARLDIRDAVRTSALSRDWRRRWEALPCISLSFLDKRGNTPTSSVAVDSVLARYPGHISSFSFHCDKYSAARVADWLLALSTRGVSSINLQCSYYYYSITLHSSLFLCTQLVHLELNGCLMPHLPAGFTGFPVLEELKLYAAQFPENGESLLEEILAASPSLNTLNLSYLYIRDDGPQNEWVIGGPTIRKLTINSDKFYGWRITDLPRLDEATIDLGKYVSSGDFQGFIAGFAQVRKLILHTCYPLPPLANGHLMETLPCTFYNLKSLILWTHFCERPAILATLCLLMNAPNLEELEITIERTFLDGIEANAENHNTQCTDAFCSNLQVVKIKGIGWLPSEMCFIELVLSKAIVLRTMYLRLGYESSKSNEDALCELMTYRRGSPHAQVFFNGEIE